MACEDGNGGWALWVVITLGKEITPYGFLLHGLGMVARLIDCMMENGPSCSTYDEFYASIKDWVSRKPTNLRM